MVVIVCEEKKTNSKNIYFNEMLSKIDSVMWGFQKNVYVKQKK